MARLFYLSTLALTAALAAAAPAAEADAATFKGLLLNANVRVLGEIRDCRPPPPLSERLTRTHHTYHPPPTHQPQLRGANKAAVTGGGSRLLPSLYSRTGAGDGRPQQPAVDPVGPPSDGKPPVTCVGKDCEHEVPGAAQGGEDGLPHIPVPVSTTTTTTVTMDDGSTLTVTCKDDECQACATSAQGRDLGCQPIVCDDDGECAVAGVDDEPDEPEPEEPEPEEPEVEEPERVPEPRAPKKTDGPGATVAPEQPAAPKPKPVTEEKEDPAAAVAGGNGN